MNFSLGASLLLATLSGVAADVNNLSRGIVICKSDKNFDDTNQALRDAINAEPDPTGLFSEVDFAQRAEDDGKTINPNNLLVWGNPALGAPLMFANREVSIDLPKKFQVYQTDDGGVYVVYTPMSHMVWRHDGLLGELDEVLNDVDELYQRVVDTTVEGMICIEKEIPDYDVPAKKKNKKKAKKDGHRMLGMNKKKKKKSMNKKKKSPIMPGAAPGLYMVKSKLDFDTTWERTLKAIEKDPRVVRFFEVDHGKNDPEGNLPPTKLAVFGNVGDVGVPLIEANQGIVMDLPLKMLVWENEADYGYTYITFNDPHYKKFRHRLEGVDDILAGMGALFEELALYAAGYY